MPGQPLPIGPPQSPEENRSRIMLNRVGFSPAQAALLQNVAGVTIRDLVTAGFTGTQAKLLKSSPSFKELLVQGKFIRKQAELLIGLT